MTITDQEAEEIMERTNWRFSEMYRRAYPSVPDMANKEPFMFKDNKGKLWFEPTHFLIKKEDYDELFKVEGSVLIGLNFVMSTPSSFYIWKGNNIIAKKIIEIFYFNDYTEQQRFNFVSAWYNLASEFEDFDWALHFETLEELINKIGNQINMINDGLIITRKVNMSDEPSDKPHLKLPKYVYFEDDEK